MRTRLKQVIDEMEIDQNKLAKMADLENYQVSKLCRNPKYDVKRTTMEKICNALKRSLHDCFGDNFKPDGKASTKPASK
jgi:DNA-binding Xre family transcriptional regulator